jgi:hypothetical protein
VTVLVERLALGSGRLNEYFVSAPGDGKRQRGIERHSHGRQTFLAEKALIDQRVFGFG